MKEWLARTDPYRRTVAKVAFAAFAILTLVGVVVFATAMLVAPARDPGHEYRYLQNGDDYFVYTIQDARTDGVIAGDWKTSLDGHPPQGLTIVPVSEIPHLLAGENATRDRNATTVRSIVSWQGWVEIRMGWWSVNHECRRASCDDERPAIVWTRGSSWKGASIDSFARGSWSADPRPTGIEPHVTGTGPILYRGVENEHNFVDWMPVLYGALIGTSIATVVTLAWWAVEERLARRSRPTSAPELGTEEMLRLVDLSERYLDALSRAFLWGGAGIVAAVALATYAVVPTLLDASSAHYGDTIDPRFVFYLAGPFLALVGIAFWAMAFDKVRRERRRLHDLRAGFRIAEARILE